MIIYFHLRKVVPKVVPKPAAASKNSLAMQIVRPTPDLVNQKNAVG